MRGFVLLVGIVVILMIIPLLLHAPWFNVSNKMKNEIIKNGLIHFTSKENCYSIMENGFKGEFSHMKGIELLLGKMVWFYPCKDDSSLFLSRKNIMRTKRAKDDPERYAVCIRVKGFNEDDLDKFYYRIGFWKNSAIVYRGEVLTAEIFEIVKI